MTPNTEAADLLNLNRELQRSPAARLLAITNLSLYATSMERPLSDGQVPETKTSPSNRVGAERASDWTGRLTSLRQAMRAKELVPAGV